jgi:hypothetical protein
MASLIPGYEYDIFISYRQKDNKYDGWVTEFVDNLKRELEATFKEDVNVKNMQVLQFSLINYCYLFLFRKSSCQTWY